MIVGLKESSLSESEIVQMIFIHVLFCFVFTSCRENHQSQMERIAWQFPDSMENDSTWREWSVAGVTRRILRHQVAILSAASLPCWQYGEITQQLQQSIRRLELRIASSIRAGNWNSKWRRNQWRRHKAWNLTKASPKIDGCRQTATATTTSAATAITVQTRGISTKCSQQQRQKQSETTTKASCHSTAQYDGRTFTFSTFDCGTNYNFTSSIAPESSTTNAKRSNIIHLIKWKAKKDWRSDNDRLWCQLKWWIPNGLKSKLPKLIQRRRLPLPHELATVSDTIYRTSKASHSDANPEVNLQGTLQRWNWWLKCKRCTP